MFSFSPVLREEIRTRFELLEAEDTALRGENPEKLGGMVETMMQYLPLRLAIPYVGP